MTFEQLQCFIASVEEKTFLDAAHSLYISQSSLSKQIMKLEQELGVMLWDRSRRKAGLTEAGNIFYQDALILLKQAGPVPDRVTADTVRGHAAHPNPIPAHARIPGLPGSPSRHTPVPA